MLFTDVKIFLSTEANSINIEVSVNWIALNYSCNFSCPQAAIVLSDMT